MSCSFSSCLSIYSVRESQIRVTVSSPIGSKADESDSKIFWTTTRGSCFIQIKFIFSIQRSSDGSVGHDCDVSSQTSRFASVNSKTSNTTILCNLSPEFRYNINEILGHRPLMSHTFISMISGVVMSLYGLIIPRSICVILYRDYENKITHLNVNLLERCEQLWSDV